jgi:uncharacterized protein YlxW (UPF0749 family)
MKGIITLLIFICLFQGDVVAQKETSAKKKTEKTAAKKSPAKKDVTPQKKKSTKLLAEKKKEVGAPAHEKEEVHAESTDSPALSEKNTAVAVDTDAEDPGQYEDTVSSKPVPTSASAAAPASDWQEWIPWLLLVLIVVMGIYIFWTNANIRATLNSIKNQLAAQKNDLNWEKTKPLLTGTEIENLINASSSLRKMQEELSALKSNIEKLQQPAPAVIPVTPVVEPQSGTFYMTGPTNNYFPSSARSNNRENTVYKFMLQPGGNEAMFEVHTTGAGIDEIIKVVESYIKPACDEENLPSSGTRNIVTKTPGRAILENEKWIIKDKAVIRYE